MIYVNKTQDEHEYNYGTKVFLYPTKQDAQDLYDYVKSLGIKNTIKPYQYHVSVIYSKHACPMAERHTIKLPIIGGLYQWRIFETQFGRCLVMEIDSAEMTLLRNEMMASYGATSPFPTFIPHITVAWNYEGDVPQLDSAMQYSIIFDSYKVGGIDRDWTPKDLDVD